MDKTFEAVPPGPKAWAEWKESLWQPIESAPKDGLAFQARIPGHGEDNIIAWESGLLDDEGNDCGGWYFADDQEPPDCWTDGICWQKNEDGTASVKPTHWKLLPDVSR